MQAFSTGVSILDRILAVKREEIALLRGEEDALARRAADAAEPRNFRDAIGRAGEVALIAEVKRRSPGAGEIRPGLDPAALASAYAGGGASALSVLTDRSFFGGSLQDLESVRAAAPLPVLRKDFILDPIQLLEARASGADAILLIVRALDDDSLGRLRREAEEGLGMTALVEAHDGEELERALAAGAGVVGINNRDLTTFETRLEVTLDLVDRVPPEVVLVSESGIFTADDVDRLGASGVDAILVGESLLRQESPKAGAEALAGRRARPRGPSRD